jgi:hypothetical protein
MLQTNKLPDSQAYLDGCSTETVFMSKKYLENLKTVDQGVKINCNAEAIRSNQVGDYGSISAWFILEGIANIFLMNKLEKKYQITYNSWEGYYVVHTASSPVRFYKDENSLPYVDLEKSSEEGAVLLVQTGSKEAANLFAQTIWQNYEGYTKREILQAKEARCTMGMIGNPSKSDFKGMVRANMIKNCPVSAGAITNARAIFGPDLASVRGKTVRQTPEPVVEDFVSVPRLIVEKNKMVTLAADVFFMDGIAFLITVSRQIKFIMAEHVTTCTDKSISKHMQRVIQVYARAGFNVHTVLMDGEFGKVKEKLPLLVCNMMAGKEHVSKAKQNIWTIKEPPRGS